MMVQTFSKFVSRGGNVERPVKVLLGKLGLDGHDRGVKVVARGLRDHGMEVVYMGMRLTADAMATAALQEDVDVVGVSILSGAHMKLIPKLTDGLRERGMEDVIVVVGGTVPDGDIPKLKEAGVDEVFLLGSSVDDIAEFIKGRLGERTLA